MLDTNHLTQAAAKALAGAGWSSDRVVSVPTIFDEFCSDRGRSASSRVRETISNFDGLSMSYPRSDTAAEVFFDVARVCRNMNDFTLEHEYEKAAGEPLLPFGQTAYGLFFLITDELRVFGGHSPFVGLYGASIPDFLNGLCQDRRPMKMAG